MTVPRLTRRQLGVLVAVLCSGSVVIIVAATLVILRPPGTGGAVTKGPFLISSSPTQTVPLCSNVSVRWTDLNGTNVTFAVWPPASGPLSSCSTAQPLSNRTAEFPSSGRHGLNGTEGGPACQQTGEGGTCSFLAHDTSYLLTEAAPGTGLRTSDSVQYFITLAT